MGDINFRELIKSRIFVGFVLSIIFCLFFCITSTIVPTHNFIFSYPYIHASKVLTWIFFLVNGFFLSLLLTVSLSEILKIISKNKIIKYIYLLAIFLFSYLNFIFVSFRYFYFYKHLFNSQAFYISFYCLICIFIIAGLIMLIRNIFNSFGLYLLVINIIIIFSFFFFPFLIIYYGWIIFLLLFFIIWANDIGAFCVGMLIGKHKISKISKNKSYEGTISGILSAIISIVILYFIFLKIKNINILLFFVKLKNNYVGLLIFITILASIFIQMGDFAFSFVKRNYKIKDYSNYLGKHGGFLDRFDSSIFGIFFISIFLVFNI